MIKWIVILIILILILSYFGVNIQSVVQSPTGQSNFSYVWNGIVYTWDTYLSSPASWLWDNVGIPLWNAFVNGLQNIKSNTATPNLGSISPQTP